MLQDTKTLINRFPVFGLWNKTAAEQHGCNETEAKCVGHAIAVLGAIRRNGGRYTCKTNNNQNQKSTDNFNSNNICINTLKINGETIPIIWQGSTFVCVVGGNPKQCQTSETYDTQIKRKFPGDYYERLESAFRDFWKRNPDKIHKQVYATYNQWKKDCADEDKKTYVNLDKLLDWIKQH